MARRHPILSLIVIICTIAGIVSFAKSFQANPTLASIRQFSNSGTNEASGAGMRSSQSTEPRDPYAEKLYESETHFNGPEQEELAQREQAEKLQDKKLQQSEQKDSKSAHESHYLAETESTAASEHHAENVDIAEIAAGKPIMAKMPNQTVRAEVGRAGWKLLHTILAQYPEEPTVEDKTALGTYIKLFSRVYPCRECAEHFQELLTRFPPQLASRKNAVMWGCNVHNDVNERLGKTVYDCDKIFTEYDCGCGSSLEEEAEAKPKSQTTDISKGG